MASIRDHIGIVENVISEIDTIDMASDSHMEQLVINRYNALKANMKKVGSYQSLNVMFSKDTDGRMRFYIVDNNQPIGFMLFVEVAIGGYSAYRVVSIWFQSSYRRQGIAAKLYDGLLKTGKAIISDSQQTHDAQAMWRSFLKKYKMFLVDNNSNLRRIYTEEEMREAYSPGTPYHSLLVLK
jgi:GNAT superfamily N-acetyltransferase